MEDKLSIRINIAEQYYPLKVNRNEEERIRKAAKLINDKLLQYNKLILKRYKGFFGNGFSTFCNKFLELEEKMDEMPVREKLTDINEEIKEYLANINNTSSFI